MAASKRITYAAKRYKLGRHAQPVTLRTNNYRASFSKSIVNDAIQRQYAKSKEFQEAISHQADALRYAIDNECMDTIKFGNLRGNL